MSGSQQKTDEKPDECGQKIMHDGLHFAGHFARELAICKGGTEGRSGGNDEGTLAYLQIK